MTSGSAGGLREMGTTVAVRLPAEAGRLAAALRSGSAVVCDLTAAPVDLRTVQALARLRLDARRAHVTVRVTGAGDELVALLRLLGLDALLAPG